ncbi:MAG: hypothetical protein AAF494_10485 [Pseudomonadota bacterium]
MLKPPVIPLPTSMIALNADFMVTSHRPVLLTMLLLAIALRSILGAPCCVDPAMALSAEHLHRADHAHHATHGSGTHEKHGDGHGDDPSANPCCSACGPTLPPDLPLIALVAPPQTMPEPATARALATRPPFPAYDATGPPLLT